MEVIVFCVKWYTVKKVNYFPSPAGMSQPKLSLAGNNLTFFTVYANFTKSGLSYSFSVFAKNRLNCVYIQFLQKIYWRAYSASIFCTAHCTVNFAYFVNVLLQSVLPLVTYCSQYFGLPSKNMLFSVCMQNNVHMITSVFLTVRVSWLLQCAKIFVLSRHVFLVLANTIYVTVKVCFV